MRTLIIVFILSLFVGCASEYKDVDERPIVKIYQGKIVSDSAKLYNDYSMNSTVSARAQWTFNGMPRGEINILSSLDQYNHPEHFVRENLAKGDEVYFYIISCTEKSGAGSAMPDYQTVRIGIYLPEYKIEQLKSDQKIRLVIESYKD